MRLRNPFRRPRPADAPPDAEGGPVDLAALLADPEQLRQTTAGLLRFSVFDYLWGTDDPWEGGSMTDTPEGLAYDPSTDPILRAYQAAVEQGEYRAAMAIQITVARQVVAEAQSAADEEVVAV